MILKVAADASQIDPAFDAERSQIAPRTDTRAQQQRRRLKRAGTQNDFVRVELQPFPIGRDSGDPARRRAVVPSITMRSTRRSA